MEESKRQDRSQVFESISNYLLSLTEIEFVPGETWSRYAGRVFDKQEYLHLADALLDGWITSGRYTEEFEYKFSRYLGVYDSLLVNSGSSANLIALSSLTSSSLGDAKIRKNNEVITVAAGFPTTINPIVQNELVPVFIDVKIGRGIALYHGEDITVISTGNMLETAVTLREMLSEKGISTGVVSLHTLKPFDSDLLERIANQTNLVVTLEEHSPFEGLSSVVSKHLKTLELEIPLITCTLPDSFVDSSGSQEYLRKYYHLDYESLFTKIYARVESERTGTGREPNA